MPVPNEPLSRLHPILKSRSVQSFTVDSGRCGNIVRARSTEATLVLRLVPSSEQVVGSSMAGNNSLAQHLNRILRLARRQEYVRG